MHRLLHHLPFIATTLLGSLFLGCVILHYGNIQFGGMDGGVLSNLAWQLELGYKPYRDIVTSVPPLFVIGAKLAFSLFDVRWNSFVQIAALFSVLTFILHITILYRLRLGIFYSCLIAFATQVLTIVPLSWWWYNQITSICACIFLSAAFLFLRNPKNLLNQVFFVLGASLLMLSKPNVAGFLLFFVTIVFLSLKQLRRRVALLLGSAALLAYIALYLFNISLLDLLSSYRTSGGRIFSWQHLFGFMFLNQQWEVIQTGILSLPLVFGTASMLYYFYKHKTSLLPYISSYEKQSFFLMLIGIATAVISTATNNDFNMIEIPIVLVGVIFFIHLVKRNFSPKIRIVIVSSVIVSIFLLTGNALRIAHQRLRIHEIGLNLFYEDVPLISLSSPHFFKGLQVSPRFLTLLQRLEKRVIQSGIHNSPNARIFFGERLDFSYAAFGIRPPKGLPLWWENFHNSSKVETQEMVERFRAIDFNLCMFWQFYSFYPEKLSEYINKAYMITHQDGKFIVLTRNAYK